MSIGTRTGFFVEDRPVSHEVVGKHAFAVVRGQDHERVFRRRQGVETILEDGQPPGPRTRSLRRRVR